MVSIGLELDEFDYTDQFIEKYKNKLIPSELINDVYAFNKAKLFIYKGEVQKANQLIGNLYFKDALYKFGLKCLEIMLFYELEEFSILEARKNAFKVSLSPNRPPIISEINTILFRNFFNSIKDLYRLCSDPNVTKKDAQQLVDFIKNTNQIANRKWVLTKAETLLKGMK